LLKKGAYDLLNEDEKAFDKFSEESLEKILERAQKRVVDKSGEGNKTENRKT